MSSPRAWIAACALASACSGDIWSPSPITTPVPDPGPSCGGERLCVGTSGLARLTAFEYQRTVVAALGTAAATATFDGLPADGRAGPFISNDESVVNDDMIAQYQLVAEGIATTASASAQTLLGCAPTAPNDTCVLAFIQRVGTPLFRAPVSSEVATVYLQLFRTIETASSATDAVRVVVSALLQDPAFLYHVRVGTPVTATVLPGVGSVVALDGHELAERLSFLLLAAPPDAALLAAADHGDLDTVAGLEQVARSLIADPRADLALGRFHTQWLDLEALPYRSFAEETYPGVQTLRGALYQETQSFGAYVMRQGDAQVSTLLTAEWTVLDPSLAAFYGVTPAPALLAKTDLPAGERSGLLTHASFLTTHTHDPSTQAVQRGKAIRELLLCQMIPPPPPNIDPRITADPSLSPRQRLEAKTSDPTCQACHSLMNPAGFLFEHFEVTGKWRDVVNDAASGKTFPVDATGVLKNTDITGTLDGARALGAALAQDEAVHQCVARQWLRYVLGRAETADDEPSLSLAYQQYLGAGRDLRELVVALVGTDAFRYRRITP